MKSVAIELDLIVKGQFRMGNSILKFGPRVDHIGNLSSFKSNVIHSLQSIWTIVSNLKFFIVLIRSN